MDVIHFLITALEHYGFGNDFIECIKILLQNQKCCLINGFHTTKYFRLKRGARQGDPISAYLFILPQKLYFYQVRQKHDGINIFNIVYTAYADDTTFF